MIEPSDDALQAIEQEVDEARRTPVDEQIEGNDLEDLFAEAQAAAPERKLRKPSTRRLDPSLREALEAASKRMREVYTNPDNWVRTQGLVLVDKESQTVIGNYSEYRHRVVAGTRKLVREHQPIEISGREEVEGFLGHRLEEHLHGIKWDSEKIVTVHVLMDELQVEAPSVEIRLCFLLNSILRAELVKDTQFSNNSGSVIMKFPAGTNLWDAVGADTKAALRKEGL